jgi:hypothetical protein
MAGAILNWTLNNAVRCGLDSFGLEEDSVKGSCENPKEPSGSITNKKKTPGLRSASELYRPSDHRLSTKLVSTLADRGCRVVSATNPHGR